MNELLLQCGQQSDFCSISLDCTVRLMFALKGQARYRAPQAVRQAQALPETDARHCLLSVRGFTNGVLAMTPLHNESSDLCTDAMKRELPDASFHHTEHVSSDDPSVKLLGTLKEIFPNLKCLSCDPLHTVFS